MHCSLIQLSYMRREGGILSGDTLSALTVVRPPLLARLLYTFSSEEFSANREPDTFTI